MPLSHTYYVSQTGEQSSLCQNLDAAAIRWQGDIRKLKLTIGYV